VILGVDKLHSLVHSQNLVENLSERELTNPEGAGFDIRIGALFRLKSAGFLGVNERETPEMEPLVEFSEGETKSIILEPGEYYVMQTIEKVNTPEDLVILFRPRSTLYRSGISLFTGNVAPGYRGVLSFGIMNKGKFPFRLEMGARVAHAQFFKVEGKTALYRGQWQDGRVTTEVREKQV